MPRITINDFEKWGELVKEWAKDPSNRPNTLQQLKDQVEGSANIAQVPSNITSLLFMPQPDDETVLVIWLPTKKAIEDVDRRIAAHEFDATGYPLPPFYREIFGDDAVRRLTPDKFETFNAERVGEYTIQECQ
jgi:hypothetical protein